jgi:hypothetical protein
MKTYEKAYLMDELDLPENAIEDRVIDTSRWSVHHEIIFLDDGKYYRTWYSIGATEQQDEWPWDHEKEVKCYEVVQRIVEVMTWVEADNVVS